MFPVLEELSITKATAIDDETAVIALVLDQLGLDPESPHSAVYKVESEIATQLGFFEIAITGLAGAGVKNSFFALGELGDVLVFGDDGISQEKVEATRGPMRNLSVIGRDLYACGANLQIFVRRSEGQWQDISPSEGLVTEFADNHLEAISGFSSNEIYAAGRKGVIWWFDGKNWVPIQSGTNLSFTGLTCAEDGFVYLVGQGGLVAKGRRDEFAVHLPPEPLVDLWDVEFFNSRIYVSAMRALMTWDEDEGLAVVPDGMRGTESYYNLCVANGTLWSLGEKDVTRFDGKEWKRIEEVRVL